MQGPEFKPKIPQNKQRAVTQLAKHGDLLAEARGSVEPKSSILHEQYRETPLQKIIKTPQFSLFKL
jgi:hypothetical protein